MKRIIFLGLAALSGTTALAQNSVVINQQGGPHEVSVIQQGASNTSVINQASARPSNHVSVVQSGSGNVATINQGNADTNTTDSQNSVNATQSGEGETIINQTKDGNSISVYQSSGNVTDRKKKVDRKKPKE
ncbi:hypothetical protein [Spirosoma validum]|uniref:Curlin associated repeat-containing protein n=1 Tax=Spirosoma validum TaxID=2771355 RepID=A0A927GD33_9BACT|nr:hypothetical protein [Spirosoma validum]MBD2753145.1 hypothetical protein [Spirosoma validum]